MTTDPYADLIRDAITAGLLPADWSEEPADRNHEDWITSLTWAAGPLRLHVSREYGEADVFITCTDGGRFAAGGARAAGPARTPRT